MGEVRILVPTGASPAGTVVGHVRALQARGRTVLLVTADRPYRALADALREAGADPQSMQFIDVVSAGGGQAPGERVPNVLFLASPTMLEMLAMRIEQVVGRIGPDAHVVLDSLNTLALYNGENPVQEFSHYLANRLRERGVPGDFVVRDGATSVSLQSKIATFADARVELPHREPA